MKRDLRSLVLTLIFFLPIAIGNAQTQIRGALVDENNEPLAAADVLLYPAGDTVWVKGDAADADGRYRLNNLKPGDYELVIISLGLSTL